MGKVPPPKKRVWQIGDLVLCKIKGHSLWPAEIADPLEHDKPPKPGQYFVAFFGCTQWAYCKNANVFPFEGKVKDTFLVTAKSKAYLQAALDQFLINWEDRERRNLVCGSSSGGQGDHPMVAAPEVKEDVGDAANIMPAREQEHEVKAVVHDPSVGDEDDDVQLVEERPSSKKGRKKRQGSLLQMTGKRGPKRRKVQPAEAAMENDDVLRDVLRDGANCAEGVAEIRGMEDNIAGQMEDASMDIHSPSVTRRGRASKQERVRFPSAGPSVHVESPSVQIRVDGADPAAGDVGAGPMRSLTGMAHVQLEGAPKRKPGRPRKRDKDPGVGQQLPGGDSVPDSSVAPSVLLLNVPPKRMRTLNGSECIEGELSDLDRTVTQKRGRARLARKPQAKALEDLQKVVSLEGMVSIPGGCEEVKMVRKCGRPSKQDNRLRHSIEGDEKGAVDQMVTAGSRAGEVFVGHIPGAVVSDIGGVRSFACPATDMRADSAGGERRKGRCGWGSIGVHDASLGKGLAHQEPKVGEKVSAEERARIAAEEAEEAAVILVEGPELKDISTPRVSRGPLGQRQSSEEVAVPRGETDTASVLDISTGVIAGTGAVRPRNTGKRGRKRGIKGGVEASTLTAPMIEDGLAVLAGEAGAVESRDTGARSPVAVKVRKRKPRKATSERPSVTVRNAREDGLAELACEAHEVEVNIGASVVSVLESTKRRGRPRKIVHPGEVQAKTAAAQEAMVTILRKSSGVERSLMSSVELAEEGKDGQPSAAEQEGVKSRRDVGVPLEGKRHRHTIAVEELVAVMTPQTTLDAPSEREGDVVENANLQADLVLDQRPDSPGLAAVKLQTGGPALQEEGIRGMAGKKGRSGSAVRRKGLAKGLEHKDVKGILQGKTGIGACLSLMPQSLNAGAPQSAYEGLIGVGSEATVPVPKALKGLLESAAGQLAAEGDNVAFCPEIAKSIQQGSKPSGDQKLVESSVGADAVKIQGTGREVVQEQRKMGAKEMVVSRTERLARGVKGKVTTNEAAVHKAGSGEVVEKPMLVECYGLGGGKLSNGGGNHEEKGDGRKRNSPVPGPAPARPPVEEAKDKLRLSYAAAKEKKARRVVKLLDGKVSVKAPLQSNWPPDMPCRKEKAAPNMGALIAEAKAKQQALALKKVPPADPDVAKPQAFPGSQETSSGDSGPVSMHLESEKEERVGMTSVRLVDAPLTDFGLPVGLTRMSVSPVEGAGSAEAPIAGLLVGLDMDAVVTLEAFEGMLETLSRNRDSISRATKHAMAAARLGLAEKVIAVVLQRLETERSMPKRVDLFFLVDSIAQAANRKRGTDSLYKPYVESALLRFLTAAAPPGSPARANRKDCLKVLKVWHERDILPKPMLEHYMAEIKKNDAKLGSPRPARWAQRGVDDPLRHMEGFVDEYGSNAFFSTMGLSLKMNNEDDFDEEYSEPDEGNHNAAAPSLVPVLEQRSPEKAPGEAILASEWEPQPSPKGTPFSMKETPFSEKEAQPDPHPSCENTEAPMDTSSHDTNTRDDDNKPRFSEVQGSSVPSTSPQYCPESAGESVYFLSTPAAESPCAMPPLPPSPPPSPPPLPEEPPPPWSPPRPSPIATPPSMAPSTFEVPAERTDGAMPAASSGRWPPVMPGVHVRGLEASALPAGGFPEVHHSMQWTHSASPGFGMKATTQQRVSPKEPRQVAVTPPPVFTPRPPSVPPPPNLGQYHNHPPSPGGYIDKGVGGGSASKSWLPPPTLNQQKLAGGGGVASPLAEVEGGAEWQVPGGVENRGGKDVSPEVLGKDVLLLERSVQRLKCDQFTKEGGAVDALLLPPPLPSGLPPAVNLSPTAHVLPPRTLPPWSAPSQPVLTTSTYTTLQNKSATQPHPPGPGALSALPRPPHLGQPSCMAPAAVLMAGGYGTQVGNSVPATRPMGVVGMYSMPPPQHMQVPMQGQHYYSNPMLPLGVGQPPPSVTFNGMGASAPLQAYPQHVRQPGVMQRPLTYQQRPLPPQFGGALGVGNRQQHPWP